MKLDKLNQKVEDLKYRLKLDNIGLNKAKYNLQNSKRLNLNEKQIKLYTDTYEYYLNKKKLDECTYNAFKAYSSEVVGNANFSDDLFKCTLPYEMVDSSFNYQTTITVDGNVVRLFANGIDANEVIDCLDNNDIKYIESNFKSNVDDSELTFKDVCVEYVDNDEIKDILDEPIVVKYNSNKYKGLIASSKIPECYPYGKFSCKDLNGDTYLPEIPSFDTIKSLYEQVGEKEKQYEKLYDIEQNVRAKMEDSISKMGEALSKANNPSLSNILKGALSDGI